MNQADRGKVMCAENPRPIRNLRHANPRGLLHDLLGPASAVQRRAFGPRRGSHCGCKAQMPMQRGRAQMVADMQKRAMTGVKQQLCAQRAAVLIVGPHAVEPHLRIKGVYRHHAAVRLESRGGVGVVSIPTSIVQAARPASPSRSIRLGSSDSS